MIEPVEKQSSVDLATSAIIKYLKSDEIKEGDKLETETSMCSKLNISRTTIREAYRKLESMGYLEIKAGSGAFVKNKTLDFSQTAKQWFADHTCELSDLIEVRLCIDPLASFIAAKKRTEEDVIELKKIQQEFELCITKNDNVSLAEVDAQFHEKIAQIAKNDLLTEIVSIINVYFCQTRQNSFLITHNVQNAIQPHRSILKAIEDGNPTAAADASSKHMLSALMDICGKNGTTVFNFTKVLSLLEK